MSAMSTKSCTTALVKLPIFVLFMIASNRSFKAAALFILLAAALVSFPISVFADFRPDSSFVAVPNAATGLDLAAGAVLDGSLSALAVKLGISGGSTLVTLDLLNSLISGTTVGTLPDYTYNQPLSQILNQETIKIRKDSVTIGGVEYSDVWLPHDVANKFRVNAFDFITHYNILSESNGTYASGVGSIDGIPMFNVNGLTRSQNYVVPAAAGSSAVGNGRIVVYWTDYPRADYVSSGGTTYDIIPSTRQYSFPMTLFFLIENGVARIHAEGYAYSNNRTLNGFISSYVAQPFDFTWVSGSIPLEPLPDEQGLRLRIPSSYVSNFPAVVSPDLADYASVITDLSNALEQSRLANSVESTAFEEYDAPAPPVPSTGTIAEEPYSSLDGSLSGIQDSLDNIDTNLGTVDESLDDIQVYASDAADSLQSIDTNLSQSVADTAGIKGFIQTYLPGIHSFLNGISTSVSNIAGSVAAADETFFGNVVDAILAPFTPVFDIFKAGVGIWRYVVAWVGNISTPFAWTWNTLSQANGIFVSPILASAAAAVVLAVYKKFGR